MHLDIFTVIVAGSAVLMLQGAIFLFFWFRDRKSVWLAWWGVPLVVGGAAMTAYLQPGWDSDFARIAFGNATRMIAVGCLWQGVRRFAGKRLLLWPLLAVAFGWIAICMLPGMLDNMVARVTIVSISNGLFCVLGAFELRVGSSERLASRVPLQVTFISFAVVMLVRVVVAPYAPFPMGAGPPDSLWVALFVMAVFGHTAFAATLFFSMTRERREEEQRGFAMSDPLTGLMNRRAFIDFAERMDRRRTGLRRAIALLVLDLDHFKSVNDQFGHEVGDRMLKAFAAIAEGGVRPSDQLFRMGGEEFCFVLPETSLSKATEVAERIRAALEAASVQTPTGLARTTVSIGIAATPYDIDLEVLLAAADAALYDAKARGRNRVVVASPGTLLSGALRDVVAPARRRA